MMKKTKIIRGGIMALFVLAALLLVYLVVRQTMPDIIPLLRSGDEEALEAYLLNVRKSWATNISKTGIEYSANVYTARVSAAIITAEGVVNVINVQLNGAADDLILTETGAQQQVPVVGTVTLHEA